MGEMQRASGQEKDVQEGEGSGFEGRQDEKEDKRPERQWMREGSDRGGQGRVSGKRHWEAAVGVGIKGTRREAALERERKGLQRRERSRRGHSAGSGRLRDGSEKGKEEGGARDQRQETSEGQGAEEARAAGTRKQ